MADTWIKDWWMTGIILALLAVCALSMLWCIGGWLFGRDKPLPPPDRAARRDAFEEDCQ